MSEVLELLSTIDDPRDPEKVIYPLSSLLFISICSIFCGAESWEDMVVFTESRKQWLSKYIDMDTGVPSYSTFRRIFSIIEPSLWVVLIEGTLGIVIKERMPEDQIPIDGKSLRGTRCASKQVRAIQMVSAWSVSNKITLADIKADRKSNEIKAIPLLLDLLTIEGCTITIDAAGCHEVILQKIIEKGGNFVIGLKKNQPTLYRAVHEYSKEYGEMPENLISDGYDESHGRSVRRRYFAYPLPEELQESALSGINTIIATETISSINNKEGVSAEWRYYVTSHSHDNPKLARYVREHRSIENQYHWQLDVHLNDDADKKYDDIAAENFARTKRLLLNLVQAKHPEGKKRSVRSRLKRIAWDMDYLISLLAL